MSKCDSAGSWWKQFWLDYWYVKRDKTAEYQTELNFFNNLTNAVDLHAATIISSLTLIYTLTLLFFHSCLAQ